MQRVIDITAKERLSDEDVAYLAGKLGGATKRDYSRYGVAADVASTGGPSSLSTLVCPLFLRAFGYCVPKVGVAGRPAGGIDVMAQIPGFRFALESNQFETVIASSGYAHSLAQADLAPLDARLFLFRRSLQAKGDEDLAIASLLAKKVALGITDLGLDVRVAAHGNFGSDWATARDNARKFCRVSKLLGIKSVCILTNGCSPYQPFLGRGESLVALHALLEGEDAESLTAHGNLCFRMAGAVGRERGSLRPKPGELKTVFAGHLRAHASDYAAFEEVANRIRQACRFDLCIEQEGFLRVDLRLLRAVLVEIQQEGHTDSEFPDPSGLVFRLPKDAYVWPGDTVASVRISHGGWHRFRERFSAAFTTVENSDPEKCFYEEVRDA